MRALARLSNLGTPRSGGGVRSSRAVWGEPPGEFLRRVAYLHETSPARERVESRELLRRDGALAAERPPVPPVARHAGVALRGLCLRTRATNERISYGSPLRARGGGSPRSLAWLAARAKLAPRSREWRCARLPTRPLPNPNVFIQRQRENVHPTDRRNPWPPLPDRARHSSPRAGSVPR